MHCSATDQRGSFVISIAGVSMRLPSSTADKRKTFRELHKAAASSFQSMNVGSARYSRARLQGHRHDQLRHAIGSYPTAQSRDECGAFQGAPRRPTFR